MLSEWLVPQLQEADIKYTVVLQLDGGAPPHFALHVCDYLNETFRGRWIGRGSDVWGFIKDRVSKMWYITREVLRTAVKETFTHVNPDYLCKTSARTWRKIQLCYNSEGLHTEVLNS
jgi:hypothetical protein